MADQQPTSSAAAQFLKELWQETRKVSLGLFKIMIPVVIVTKILATLGIIPYLGVAVSPVMRLVGLPGELGLVWATAMVTNLYGGLAVYGTVAAGLDLSVAQITTLTTLMLFAHGLPVELRIAQKAGPRARFILPLRIGTALAFGIIFSHACRAAGILQQASTALWQPPPSQDGWLNWGLGQFKNLGTIFLIILVLVFVLKILARLGVSRWLTRLLRPLLRLMGMSEAAAPITVVGMTLGLSYGGGLIIEESRSGRLGRQDVLSSVALMSICHSLIEDVLLMMAVGGHQLGVLWGRAVLSIVIVAIVARVIARLPEATIQRHFFRAPVPVIPVTCRNTGRSCASSSRSAAPSGTCRSGSSCSDPSSTHRWGR